MFWNWVLLGLAVLAIIVGKGLFFIWKIINFIFSTSDPTDSKN